MEDQTLINGLLAKRQELTNLNAELRERMAIVANDIDAVERVLDSLGYSGQLVGNTPRAARIVLFYRNELRDYLKAELAKSPEPLRRLMTDVTRRVGCALRKMRAARVVEGERTQAGQVWRTIGTLR